jgi:hypothetical protein
LAMISGAEPMSVVMVFIVDTRKWGAGIASD